MQIVGSDSTFSTPGSGIPAAYVPYTAQTAWLTDLWFATIILRECDLFKYIIDRD